jgi:hemolysin activation/secretion protein
MPRPNPAPTPPRSRKTIRARAFVAWLLPFGLASLLASPAAEPPPSAAPANPPASTAPVPHLFIRQYRVKGGAHLIPQRQIEAAVYPYLGPYRTKEDVEQARAALEQAYRDAGYQTVTVSIPPQQGAGGIIVLQVQPNPVGRLRIHGSRYYSLDQIRREAPSLGENSSPNFTQVANELGNLNRSPDLVVTPALRTGVEPGTVDVDLNVKDTLPLHGSVEINNRYSADTTPLRINVAASYDNLWQLQHTIGFSYQISPENPHQVEVVSGYYIAPVPQFSWLSLELQGTDQDSNVNTLGGIGVAGKGDIIGASAIITLPPQKDFFHSLSLGIDYKNYRQGVTIAGQVSNTPVTYYPVTAAYSGTWLAKGYETDLNAGLTVDTREAGSGEATFEENRHGADASFAYFRGDLSHTRDLPGGAQIFVKAQGQIADKPLVNSEQFSGGGLGTVRGYLESEVLGDNALLGSAELRSPSLSTLLGKTVDEWRFYGFADGGFLTVDQTLVEQDSFYNLASIGLGTRIKLRRHFNGSLDFALPLVNGIQTAAYAPRFTFRLWADF